MNARAGAATVRATKGMDRASLTRAQKMAVVVADGGITQAITAINWLAPSCGEIDNQLFGRVLDEQVNDAIKGDFSHLEGTLVGQASALDAMFHELSRRALLNASNPDLMDRYLRLAFKAQSQFRSSLESLAEIKNPRQVAFVRQANIAQNQQVNNDGQSARARAKKPKKQQNELLAVTHEPALDTSSAQAPSRGYQVVEAVGAVDRPAQPGRKAPSKSQRMEGRQSPIDARIGQVTQIDAIDVRCDTT